MSPYGTPVPPDPSVDVEGYLARLGLQRPARPDVASLFALQRTHMERVPFENVEIQLDRPTSVDPAESIARIARDRGGYCFHLNGAFATLLATLGYEVHRHLGQVRGAANQDAVELTVNHQTLTVRCEDSWWLVDVGLGDAPHEPMPLRTGSATQGPFTYRLEPWSAREGGWRFVHDPAARSLHSMVFAPESVPQEAFAEAHARLSTSADSGFVKALVVSKRDAAGAHVLRGRVFEHFDGTAPAREPRIVDRREEWFDLLADVYGLRLPEIDAAARDHLWARVSARHEAWLAERREEAEQEETAAQNEASERREAALSEKAEKSP